MLHIPNAERIMIKMRPGLVVALASRKHKYDQRLCAFFISFILHSLYSTSSEVVLFAFFFPSRVKLIDRQCDYHSKNDAPCWNRVKKIC